MRLPFCRNENAQLEGEPCSPNTLGVASGVSTPSPQSQATVSPKWLDWRLMLAVSFAILLEALDYTFADTGQFLVASSFDALPLQSYLSASYLIASTVFLPLFASVADIYGRYFGIQLSLALLLVGNVLCTGAVSMSMMLLGRVIAGVGAAGLLVITRTLASETQSLNKNNMQQSMLLSFYVAGFDCGPTIGALLIHYSFRWAFGAILLLTVISMFLCFILLRNRLRSDEQRSQSVTYLSGYRSSRHTPPIKARRWASKLALVDWIGTFLFVSGGILFFFALYWGLDNNWKSARVIVNLILGVLLVVLCALWGTFLERYRSSSLERNGSRLFLARPMLPIEIFTSYDMCVVQYISFISGIVTAAMFGLTAIFAASATGFGLQGQIYFTPGVGIGMAISMPMIKYLRQPIYPVVLGCVIMTVGIGLVQSLTQDGRQIQRIRFMEMVGVGVGLVGVPLAIHARFTKPRHIAIVNAMLSFSQALGGAVGIAQCYTILNSKVNTDISSHLQMTAESLSPSDAAAIKSLLENGLASVTNLGQLPSAVQIVTKNAILDGMKWSFISLLPWIGLGTVLSLFLGKIVDSDAQIERQGEVQGESEAVETEVVPAPLVSGNVKTQA